MSEKFLSYGRQTVTDEDIACVIEVLKSDFLTQGPAVPKFENDFCRVTGAAHAVACSSGTAALHIAAIALGIKPGDRALVTPITFVASANCIRYMGGEVAFADIDSETFTLSPASAERALKAAADSGRPFKVIVTVDLAGCPCDMEAFAELKLKYNLIWIHDACHSLGGAWKDKSGRVWRVGEFEAPDATAWSFHPVKHVTTGEGGMVTTFSDEIADKLRFARTHGITKEPSRFSIKSEAFDTDGQPNPWYYEVQTLGFNYRLTDFQAALGSSQLSRLQQSVLRRNEIAARYRDGLKNIKGLKVPMPPAEIKHAYHLAIVLIDFAALKTTRAKVMRALHERNIGTQVHYVPIPMMPFYAGSADMKNLPATCEYYKKALSLPCYPALSDSDVDRVIADLKEILSA